MCYKTYTRNTVSINITISLLCAYSVFHCTGLISPSTLLIGYYHSLLLRDIDADVLLDKMSTNGLIASHDQELISASHSNHQQNWLLLEHVRHMEMEELVKFCKFVEESSPQLGLQLVTGMEVLWYLVIKCYLL